MTRSVTFTGMQRLLCALTRSSRATYLPHRKLRKRLGCVFRLGFGYKWTPRKTYVVHALDLLLDQGNWIGRPAQVVAAFADNEEHRRAHGQDAGRRGRVQRHGIMWQPAVICFPRLLQNKLNKQFLMVLPYQSRIHRLPGLYVDSIDLSVHSIRTWYGCRWSLSYHNWSSHVPSFQHISSDYQLLAYVHSCLHENWCVTFTQHSTHSTNIIKDITHSSHTVLGGGHVAIMHDAESKLIDIGGYFLNGSKVQWVFYWMIAMMMISRYHENSREIPSCSCLR